MIAVDRSSRYCILGAGSSGLTVVKNFQSLGIPCDCLEREDDVGGNWYYGKPGSAVYRSAHMISSKRLTEFTDFPMPRAFPPFPSQEQAWQYLRSYAEHFELRNCIEFNTSVKNVQRANDAWEVTLASGERRHYRGVVVANGHNWDPRQPAPPGHFDGLTLHSARYKTPEVLAGRRVLVVGAGNSGCDIAVESAQHAARTFQSLRRGYHYLPKFLLGKPIDQCGERLLRWRFPLWLRRTITARLTKLALGNPQDYGLPAPDHKLLQTHPIINSQMLYYVGHGKITPKPDVARLRGGQVEFSDGSREEIDVIVYATGFKISFPFLDPSYLNWRDDRPRLFLNVFHPEHDDLFFAGLIQPDSGQWGLVDYQAQLIGRYIVGRDRRTPAAERFRRMKASPAGDLGAGIHYVPSPRHLLEVEHFSYRRRLRKLIASLA